MNMDGESLCFSRIERRTASVTICSALLICPAGTTGFAAVCRFGFF